MNQTQCIISENRRDFGQDPMVFNIDRVTRANSFFRRALWTDDTMQVVLMSIAVGGEIGLEVHEKVNQFIRIESGYALVRMGCNPKNLTVCERADSNSAIIVPAGIWHNILNAGNIPLKLYTIYAPAQHRAGTVHETAQIEKLEED